MDKCSTSAIILTCPFRFNWPSALDLTLGPLSGSSFPFIRKGEAGLRGGGWFAENGEQNKLK